MQQESLNTSGVICQCIIVLYSQAVLWMILSLLQQRVSQDYLSLCKVRANCTKQETTNLANCHEESFPGKFGTEQTMKDSLAVKILPSRLIETCEWNLLEIKNRKDKKILVHSVQTKTWFLDSEPEHPRLSQLKKIKSPCNQTRPPGRSRRL